jgi:AcrR family transcriptional regulator
VRTKAKRWGGRTGAERRAERRQRLIDAATEIWSESGWAAVTMRGVCSRTSLNDRYFYEDFKTRDELLVAAWDGVRNEMLGEVSATLAERVGQPPLETIRMTISMVVDRITQDPGRAKILLTQHVGSSPLQDRRAVALQEATHLVVAASKPHLRPDADETALRMDTLVAVGGFVELITAWHAGLLDVSQEEIVEHTSRLAETLAERYLVHALSVDDVPGTLPS